MTGAVTISRHLSDQYVRSYRVLYSLDCSTWTIVNTTSEPWTVRLRLCSHVCAQSSVIRTHHLRPEIKKYALITFYRSVQMCTHTSSAIRVLHPPSALNRSLLDFLTCADRSGWQIIISTRIIILIEISHQITE